MFKMMLGALCTTQMQSQIFVVNMIAFLFVTYVYVCVFFFEGGGNCSDSLEMSLTSFYNTY